MKITKETFVIRTPEYVRFQYVLAGLGSRATAFLLDTAIRFLFILCLLFSAILISEWLPAVIPMDLFRKLSKSWIMALGVLAYGVIDLGYFLFFEALWSGQTPGKRQQRLRVIKSNGEPIGWLESSIRNILRAVDILLGFYPVGLIVMFLSKSNQRLGDYAAGTVVIVERRRKVPKGRTHLRPSANLKYPEIQSHVTQLKAQQYQVLRSFLERREAMDETHRRQIAQMLVRQLTEHWKIRPQFDVSNELFLEEVVVLYEQTKRTV
jgi:uncharacterized RDD family membrane protein YckC